LAVSKGDGIGGDPRVQFTPSESKTYYVQVSDVANGGGSYTLKSWTPGNPGNDSLYDTPAADVIDAGAGIDTMIYAGKHADYTVARSGNTVSVAAKAGGATDMLTGVERIQFADETVLFDSGGVAAQAYRLYKAAFDRVPDSAGLGYWIKVMENGASLKDVAAGFAASSEFKQLYGDHPSNAALTTRFYDNVLHRPADQPGHDYWVGVLDGGASVGDVLASFSESPENQAALATVIGNGFAYTPYGA
jgi:Ca2+-binding RTX toxin-like protein